jgi:hypothetical protein
MGVLLCLSGLLAVSSGCEKSPRQKLIQAKVALSNDDVDKAKTKLEEVLSVQKDNLEAKRLMGEVYRLKEQYKRAEEHLEKIWNEQGLGDEGAKLSARQRQVKQRLKVQFVDLYTNWAKSLDSAKSPDKYEEILRSGLKYNERNMDLNDMLVGFYWEHGKRLVEQGKKKEAAKTFEKIGNLRTRRGDDRRQKARKKARDLQLEFFKEKGRKRFEEKAKSLIGEMDGFSLEDDTIVIEFEQDVDRRLNPNKKKHAAKAKQIAYLALINQMRKIALSIAGMPMDSDISAIGTSRAKTVLLGKLNLGDPDFRRGEYTINAEISVDKAIGMAYDLKNAFEEAEESKEKGGEGSKKGGDEKKKEGKDSKKGDEKGSKGDEK